MLKELKELFHVVVTSLPSLYVPLYILLLPNNTKFVENRMYVFNVWAFIISFFVIILAESNFLDRPSVKPVYIWLLVVTNLVEICQVTRNSNIIYLLLLIYMVYSIIMVLLNLSGLSLSQLIIVFILSIVFIASPSTLLPVLVSFLFFPVIDLICSNLFFKEVSPFLYKFKLNNVLFNLNNNGFIDRLQSYPHLAKAAWGVISVLMYITKLVANWLSRTSLIKAIVGDTFEFFKQFFSFEVVLASMLFFVILGILCISIFNQCKKHFRGSISEKIIGRVFH